MYKKEKNCEAERSASFQLFESFMESAPQLLLQMYILAVKVSTATNSSTNQHDENSTATNNTELNGNYSLSTAAVNSSTDLHSINLINTLTANDERNSYSIIFKLN